MEERKRSSAPALRLEADLWSMSPCQHENHQLYIDTKHALSVTLISALPRTYKTRLSRSLPIDISPIGIRQSHGTPSMQLFIAYLFSESLLGLGNTVLRVKTPRSPAIMFSGFASQYRALTESNTAIGFRTGCDR